MLGSAEMFSEFRYFRAISRGGGIDFIGLFGLKFQSL